jgi:hypothetical protein
MIGAMSNAVPCWILGDAYAMPTQAHAVFNELGSHVVHHSPAWPSSLSSDGV